MSLSKKTLLFVVICLAFSAIYSGKKYYHEHKLTKEILSTKLFSNYKHIKSIDKIYILNLDKHPERYKRITKLLDDFRLPVKYERFSATNGREVNFISLDSPDLTTKIPIDQYMSGDASSFLQLKKLRIECPNSKLNDFWVNNSRTLTNKMGGRFIGEVGCYCSHREIWNDIIENGYTKVLILEDDLGFQDHFKELLELSLKNIPLDADLIYVGIFRQPHSLDLSTIKKHYTKVLANVGSTEAYIITKRGAQILLQETKQYKLPVDLEMSEIIESGKLSAYAVYPLLTWQALESNISSGN